MQKHIVELTVEQYNYLSELLVNRAHELERRATDYPAYKHCYVEENNRIESLLSDQLGGKAICFEGICRSTERTKNL